MKDVRIFGVDLGENYCSVAGLDAAGRVCCPPTHGAADNWFQTQGDDALIPTMTADKTLWANGDCPPRRDIRSPHYQFATG
jgi:hypothetical protein